ncbi:phage tail spike protein, partial [Bacillus cereus]|nr:phage tail spike protein [Bacillus cereus]
YWEDKRHWEIKNNIDTLDFKTFDGTPHAITLQQQNLVLKEVRDGRIVPYVINNEVEKDSNDRSLTVHSSGAWVQIAKDGFIKPQRIESETVNTFIDIALADSKWKRGKTDYSSFHTMTIDEFIDPLTFLKKIAALFELEIQYRVEVVGSQITGWYVDMIKKRGQETGKEVVLEKDLVGVRRIEHSRDICTALVGFVRGEGDKPITIETINNGLPYIVDNDAFQRWNAHGKHKFGFYTPETEQDITPERLMTLMKTELAKRVNTFISYEVQAQSIGRIFGLAHELINEGDTIRIKDTGFTPKLYLEARVIAGDESFTDPSQDQYVFGDYREITDANEELRKMYNKIRATLGNKANKELLDRLEELVKDTDKKVTEAQKDSQAAKELAEKVQENLKNNTVEIIEAVNQPTTNLKIGKTIWRDISNGKPGVLKVWNGKDWELLIPDVESIKKDTLEQVNKDIELTKEELNKKVEEAQEETTGQFNQVTESLQKVTRTISDVQRDQGEIDKKVTKFEQDSEGFKTSIETLTKNSTDTTSKINTLVNDVDGNKRVISEVKESVANFNDDVRNLLIGSKSFDGALTIAQADNRWWLKSADKVKISKDVFQGNTVVETQSSWTALAYNFKDLVDRKVVKVGDKVTYSIFTRVKGLPDGQELQHTFYFAPGATGIRPNKSTNQWQRVSVSFVVTAGMMSSPGTDNESHFRVEPDANPPAGCWYQQSSPQLIITIGNKEYSWRPAPEDLADGNVLTKVTTEIKEAAGKISEKLTKIETKVNNDKAGGRNLLLDSNVKYEKTDYLINPYSLTENFVAGEEYTFVIKGSVPQGQQFGIWQNGGSNNVGYATSVYANGITYVTFKAVTTTSGNERRLNLYNYPNNATKATVEWVALYKGNKPQDWTPAPENQVTNDEFTKKTTEIEKSVNGIKESIKTVEKTQVDFSERVTTVEKTADGIKEKVTSLQEIQTKQGTQLQEAKAGWETTAKALEGKVEIKDVEDYVGGIGNQTVLRNVLWKNDTKYWILQSGTTRDTTVLYKGCNTLRTISTGNTADVYRGATHEVINAGPGWNYVFSAYFYTDNKSSIDNGAKMELKCLDANGNVLKQYGQEITLTQGMWVRHHVFGLLVEGTKKVQVQYWLRRNGRLWAAQPMLQIGDKPSSFMENPVDIVDKDKIMEEVADKIATEDYTKKVTELERSISATEKGVSIISGKQETFINETYNAYVKKTESRLEVLDEGILAQILKDGIITSINMSPGKITIDAEKLNINADTMVKWLTAKGIDTNLIRIDGDKITIDKDGVTVKMLDFLFQDEWGTKTTAVSRRNLIADPDFSSVTKKNIGHNDYYGFEGGYGLTWKSWGNVVIEKNTHIFDYEQMVNAARVDMYNYPETIVNNGIHPGNEYTLSAHFRTAMINGVRKTGKPRLQVCCVKFRDNVSYDIWNEQKMDFPEPSTFYGEIRRYSFTFKVPTNYIPQQHALIIKVCSGNADMRQGTAICVSGVTLYSGKYASMYNWDRAAAERADGIQPFNALAVGGVNNNISPAPDGQTFDISTEKEVKIFRNIRAMQGVNLGGGGFQQWGHIRFTDGNAGAGFYTSTPSGWKFNALG